MRRLATAEPGFAEAFRALVLQARDTTANVGEAVAAILADVRQRGDEAVCEHTKKFDGFTVGPGGLRIGAEEMAEAERAIPAALLAALDLAATRIEAFHRAQLPADYTIRDDAGLHLGLRWTPLDSVGVYVPGGKAAYPSSVLMNVLPARIAGVGRVAMAVPCPGGVVNGLVLAAARRAGVSEVYRMGGAQAVAALAFGTATIAPVDRIVGPGNAYVAEAKRQVFGTVGIDSIAGPSEVVVLADGRQNPHHVALDLLAQAEHDEAAQSILITDDAAFGDAVARAVEDALAGLKRAAIAGASWRDHGCIIVVRSLEEAPDLVNALAPEHLQIMTPDPAALFLRIRHAGAVFLGPDCPEAVGDYVAGPNHVLPTGRTARFASGLSVFDFLKRTTYVFADRAALGRVGPAAVALAEAEGLTAHAESIRVRLTAT